MPCMSYKAHRASQAPPTSAALGRGRWATPPQAEVALSHFTVLGVAVGSRRRPVPEHLEPPDPWDASPDRLTTKSIRGLAGGPETTASGGAPGWAALRYTSIPMT
jgi:hypothetical protein